MCSLMWREARNDCAQLNTDLYAGYTGWRLPEIGELKSIYDGSSAAEFKVKSPIAVASCTYNSLPITFWQIWSATPKAGASEAMAFNFHFGSEQSLELQGKAQALCVRRPGK
jgi:hypothetical protein